MGTHLLEAPYRKRLPLFARPLFASFFLTFLGLVVGCFWAYFISYTVGLVDWAGLSTIGSLSDAAPSETLLLSFFARTLFTRPWWGLLWGIVVGVFLAVWQRYLIVRNLDAFAERLIRKPRYSIFRMPPRDSQKLIVIVLGCFGVLVLGAWLFGVSIKSAIWGTLIPQFITYRAHTSVYRVAREKFQAAMDEGIVPGDSMRPTLSEKIWVSVAISIYAAIPVVLGFLVCHAWTDIKEMHEFFLEVAGRLLSAEEAEALERSLTKHPEDPDAHIKLVGYYESLLAAADSDVKAGARKTRATHCLWLIEHYPQTSAEMTLSRHDGDAYEEAKGLWQKQIGEHPEDPKVLMNAADFFAYADGRKAEEILEKGKAIEPKNSEWGEKLEIVRSIRQKRAERPTEAYK